MPPFPTLTTDVFPMAGSLATMRRASCCVPFHTRADSAPCLAIVPGTSRSPRNNVGLNSEIIFCVVRYYVDTRAQPPRSSWEHPLNHQPPPGSPPGSYPPPSNPPPSRNYPSGGPPTYNQPGQPYAAQTTQPQAYSGGGYPANSQEVRAYSQPGYTPQQSHGGPPPSNYNQQWGQWQQPPPQPGTSYVSTEYNDTQALLLPLAYPAQPPPQAVQPPPQSGRGGRHGGIGTGLLGASDDSPRLHGVDTDD
jgi:hypothetical protein